MMFCDKIASSALPTVDCIVHGAWAGSFGFYVGDTFYGQGVISVGAMVALALLFAAAWVMDRAG